MSLYLKYRPKTFTDIVSQAHVRTTLKNAIKDEKLVHAYLFCGSRGTGKTSTARVLAKSINCTSRGEDLEPCNNCENCIAADNGSLVDLIEIDAASNRGIDEMRDLREKIHFSPTQAKYKVFIIDEVHMLTKEAFNAILKTLEEPPDHAYFILATTEVHKIPETIISRCQRFNFKRMSTENLISRLEFIAKEEDITCEKEALELIARQANGGMRDAISLFEQMASEKNVTYDSVRSSLGIVGPQINTEFFDTLLAKDTHKAFQTIEKIHEEGYDLEQFIQEFLLFLREKMQIHIKDAQKLQSILHCIEAFTPALHQIKSAFIPQLPVEIAIVKSTTVSQNLQQSAPQSTPQPAPTAVQQHSPAPKTTPPPSFQPKTQEPPAQKLSSPQPKPKPTETIQKMPEVKNEETSNSSSSEPISSSSPETASPAEPVTETTEKLEETPQEAHVEGDLNIAVIKRKWPDFTAAIKTPFVKVLLKYSKPCEFNGEDLVLGFPNEFQMNKIKNVDAKQKEEILTTMGTIFGKPLQFTCKIVEGFNIPKAKKPETPRQQMESGSGENVQEMIQSIFG